MENKERVRNYHKQLTDIKVRVPSPDAEKNIPDYLALIKERAEQLGFTNTKGKDKGKGNVNAYILHLIETDMNIKIVKGMLEAKQQEQT